MMKNCISAAIEKMARLGTMCNSFLIYSLCWIITRHLLKESENHQSKLKENPDRFDQKPINSDQGRPTQIGIDTETTPGPSDIEPTLMGSTQLGEMDGSSACY